MLTLSHSVSEYTIPMYPVNKRGFSIPAYVCWINMHFGPCNIIPRLPLSHWNAHIKSFSICIFLSDVSGGWKDSILFLHISDNLIYTFDHVISFPDHH